MAHRFSEERQKNKKQKTTKKQPKKTNKKTVRYPKGWLTININHPLKEGEVDSEQVGKHGTE